MVRRLIAEARPYRLHLVGVFALGLAATPIALLAPLPLKIAVDSAVNEHPLPGPLRAVVGPTPSVLGVLVLAAGLQVLVVALGQLQSVALDLLSAYTGERLTLSFRARLFRHVQRVSVAYHDERGTADSIYRIQYDAVAIRDVLIDGLVPFVSASIAVTAMLYVTARIDVALAIVGVAVSPVLLVSARRYRQRTRDRYSAAKHLESRALGVVHEVLGGLRVVQAFGREESEQRRFLETSQEGVRARVRLTLAEGLFSIVLNVVTAIGTAVVLVIGVQAVRSGRLTLGELLIVLAYLTQLYSPLKTVSKKAADLQMSMAGAERAFELLDRSPDVADEPNARPLARASGEVSFRGVRFAFSRRRPVLARLSFTIPAGARVAVVGRTGVGKTTLVNLMMRVFDPTSGQVLLDGVDLRDYRLKDLRNQFSIVLQDPVLFSTSIRENIAYARPEAGPDEVVAAARAAGADRFIARLPQGYDTPVGERGLRLSGGERQRISLARAFLKDAPILILDEPTSSVDADTEADILDASERLMRGRTTILITHRTSVAERFPVRLELDAGRLTRSSRAEAPLLHPLGWRSRRTIAAKRRSASSPSGAGMRVRPSDVGDPTTHPAAVAWRSIPGARTPDAVEEVLTPNGRPPHESKVYRLSGARRSRTAVVAKTSPAARLAVEHLVYERVLPPLQVAAPALRGFVGAADGSWLFLDEVVGEPYREDVPSHRAAGASWVATLHIAAREVERPSGLAPRAAQGYRSELRAALGHLGSVRANAGLTEGAGRLLRRIAAHLEALDASWSLLATWCDRVGPTLVHGDLTTKNVRIRRVRGRVAAVAVDWDSAGWGTPAVDLAAIDLRRYAHEMRASAERPDGVTLERVALAGRVFRTVGWIERTIPSIASPWPGRALRRLDGYEQALSACRAEMAGAR